MAGNGTRWILSSPLFLLFLSVGHLYANEDPGHCRTILNKLRGAARLLGEKEHAEAANQLLNLFGQPELAARMTPLDRLHASKLMARTLEDPVDAINTLASGIGKAKEAPPDPHLADAIAKAEDELSELRRYTAKQLMRRRDWKAAEQQIKQVDPLEFSGREDVYLSHSSTISLFSSILSLSTPRTEAELRSLVNETHQVLYATTFADPKLRAILYYRLGSLLNDFSPENILSEASRFAVRTDRLERALTYIETSLILDPHNINSLTLLGTLHAALASLSSSDIDFVTHLQKTAEAFQLVLDLNPFLEESDFRNQQSPIAWSSYEQFLSWRASIKDSRDHATGMLEEFSNQSIADEVVLPDPWLRDTIERARKKMKHHHWKEAEALLMQTQAREQRELKEHRLLEDRVLKEFLSLLADRALYNEGSLELMLIEVENLLHERVYADRQLRAEIHFRTAEKLYRYEPSSIFQGQTNPEFEVARLRRARQHLEAALALRPRHAMAWTLLGDVQEARGRMASASRVRYLEEAIRSHQRALELTATVQQSTFRGTPAEQSWGTWDAFSSWRSSLPGRIEKITDLINNPPSNAVDSPAPHELRTVQNTRLLNVTYDITHLSQVDHATVLATIKQAEQTLNETPYADDVHRGELYYAMARLLETTTAFNGPETNRNESGNVIGFEESARFYSAALDLLPNNADIWLRLGMVYKTHASFSLNPGQLFRSAHESFGRAILSSFKEVRFGEKWRQHVQNLQNEVSSQLTSE